MRGLIRTTIIIAVLIAIGIGTSYVITTDMDNRLAATSRRGFEEGHVEGYEEGLQEGSRVGYQEGSKAGLEEVARGDYDISPESGFYFLYNPTYEEVQEILAEDTSGSAKEMNDSAESRGIRTAYVRCRISTLEDEGKIYLLELVAFETVDEGLIFIEPSSQQEAELQIGRRYSELNRSSPLTFDGIISDIKIVW
jgi:hypothetical protein